MSTPRRRAADPLPASFAGTARFELLRTIGEGGMGVVYEALDRERAMTVALKTVRDVDPQALFRLKTEFRARADVEHRNLVRLGELLHDSRHWFFTMELVEGTTFLSWVTDGETVSDAPTFDGVLAHDVSGERPIDQPSSRPRRGFDERRLRASLRQLAQGLDVLHRAGMVHRDLKPSNVMVTAKGRVVVLDFGLVAEASGHASDRDIVGTAAYMAPEQAMSRPVGPAADWYSVGVMLFEALTGRLPIDGAPLEILMNKQRDRAPSPQELADVPDDLAALCSDLLAIDPAARPSGAAILRRLDAAPGEPARTPFVGRAAELAALDATLREVIAGGAVTACIEGESGIGKSALVRRFVAGLEGRADRPLVLAGRCHPRETVPFKGVDGVVDAIARALGRIDLGEVVLPTGSELAALATLFPVLLRVPAIARVRAAVPANPLELRARAFRGLRHLLEALGAHRPLVVSIDDVQWADGDSLAVLRELVAAPGAPRMLLVLTRRDGALPDLPVAIRTITMARLSADEASALVALVAPERAAETPTLIAGAGGHPMFLRELLRHPAPPRGPSLDDALWARITRMDDTARRILELLAVAGAPVPPALIGEALGLEARTAAKWLGVLRAASLVRTGGSRSGDPIEPYHERVRAAVLARIPAPRRRRYHERLAGLMIAAGLDERDPMTIVRHLEGAGHAERAAALARRAARRTSETVAFEQIAALCEAALRLWPDSDGDSQRDLMIRRAEALACAGRGAEAAAAFLAVADELDGEKAFQCRREAAELLLISGHFGDGMRVLDQVLAAIGDRVPRSPRAARRRLAWRWLRLAVRGTRFVPQPVARRPRAEIVRIEVYRTASLGLGLVDAIVGAGFQAQALRIALRIGDRRRVAYALAYHAMYVAAAGGRAIPRARRRIAEAKALAEECRSGFLRGWARAGEGVVEYFAGNFAGAVESLLDGEAQLREHTRGTASELQHLRMFVLWTLRRLGDHDALRAHYVEYVRDALRRSDRYAATTYRWSASVTWLAADDLERARAEIAAGAWSPPEDGLHLQHWFHARARTELALYEADTAALAACEAALRGFRGGVLDHVEAVRTETALELGRIAILRRDLAGVREAVARLRRERSPYVQTVVLQLEAAAHALEGHPAAARATLFDLVGRAEASGLPVLAALARRRAGALTAGVEGTRHLAEADATLRRRGIAAPARFARAFATWPTDAP